MKKNNVCLCVVWLSVLLFLCCSGCQFVNIVEDKETEPEPSQIVCVWKMIPEGVVLHDADSDDRYELLRTQDGIMYRLKGTNESEHPECSWRLRHRLCTVDGCTFIHNTKKTTYDLSNNNDILTLIRREKRAFGNEPKKFRLK